MIAFRDFSSKHFARPEGIDHALVEANEWLVRTGIKPLNIETLTQFDGTRQMNSASIGLRVWYLVGASDSAAR